ITHALAESMLFLGLGSLATIANTRRIDALQGYGRSYPVLSVPIAVGALSLLGVAPLGGFFSKYTLFLAFSSANLWHYAILIIVISGISALGYFKILYTIFVQRPRETKKISVFIASFPCMLIALVLIIIGVIYAQGYLFELLHRGCSKILSLEGLKEYIYTVDHSAKILGLGELP
ncbi:MAG: proton-conducting transporter membrane subunit, partial [Ignisphaera sp.]